MKKITAMRICTVSDDIVVVCCSNCNENNTINVLLQCIIKVDNTKHDTRLIHKVCHTSDARAIGRWSMSQRGRRVKSWTPLIALSVPLYI